MHGQFLLQVYFLGKKKLVNSSHFLARICVIFPLLENLRLLQLKRGIMERRLFYEIVESNLLLQEYEKFLLASGPFLENQRQKSLNRYCKPYGAGSMRDGQSSFHSSRCEIASVKCHFSSFPSPPKSVTISRCKLVKN